jgi:hypothetical protein
MDVVVPARRPTTVRTVRSRTGHIKVRTWRRREWRWHWLMRCPTSRPWPVEWTRRPLPRRLRPSARPDPGPDILRSALGSAERTASIGSGDANSPRAMPTAWRWSPDESDTVQGGQLRQGRFPRRSKSGHSKVRTLLLENPHQHSVPEGYVRSSGIMRSLRRLMKTPLVMGRCVNTAMVKGVPVFRR